MYIINRDWKLGKKRKYGNKNFFYINSHLKEGLEIDFTAC